jgi:hypothetical protein
MLWIGSGEVIACSFTELEKLRCDVSADSVRAEIGGAGIAASVAEEAGDRVIGTISQRFSKQTP